MFQVVNTEAAASQGLAANLVGDLRGRWEGDALVIEALS